MLWPYINSHIIVPTDMCSRWPIFHIVANLKWKKKTNNYILLNMLRQNVNSALNIVDLVSIHYATLCRCVQVGFNWFWWLWWGPVRECVTNMHVSVLIWGGNQQLYFNLFFLYKITHFNFLPTRAKNILKPYHKHWPNRIKDFQFQLAHTAFFFFIVCVYFCFVLLFYSTEN